MLSKRLKEITKFVSKNDSVLDLGCDHAYLSIYLKKNNLCKNVIASDVSRGALEIANNNIKKNNLEIHTYLSDGFKNIDEFYDTAIIAGMGTSTILNILKEPSPNKLIISSHNDHYLLRKKINKLGYILKKENVIYDKEHYYVIMLYEKGFERVSNIKLKYGISNNKDYYKYLYNKNTELLKKVGIIKKIKIIIDLIELKILIEKK